MIYILVPRACGSYVRQQELLALQYVLASIYCEYDLIIFHSRVLFVFTRVPFVLTRVYSCSLVFISVLDHIQFARALRKLKIVSNQKRNDKFGHFLDICTTEIYYI